MSVPVLMLVDTLQWYLAYNVYKYYQYQTCVSQCGNDDSNFGNKVLQKPFKQEEFFEKLVQKMESSIQYVKQIQI